MKTRIVFASLMIAVSTSAFADGPAFNCAKASTKVEKMICADPTLSAADSVNADLYREVLQASDNQNQAKQEQRQWLKTRNSCHTVRCIGEAYNTRYNQLQHERLANNGVVNPDGSTGH